MSFCCPVKCPIKYIIRPMDTINQLQTNTTVFAIYTGVFGLAIGSFLNVIIHRLPIMLKHAWEKECLEYLGKSFIFPAKMFNLLVPRSHCPKCLQPIPLWANIPLISFAILKGKCHKCSANISWRYPLVEFLSGLASFFIAYKFGVSWQTLATLILTWGLIALFFIDIDHMLLPDDLTLALLWIGLLFNAILHPFTDAATAILGATIGYISLWLIAYLFKLIRKVDGMGHGDFKLFALFGAWLGWKFLPIIILGAAVLGSIFGIIAILNKKHHYQKPIPFGPFLIIMGCFPIFYGDKLMVWLSRFIA